MDEINTSNNEIESYNETTLKAMEDAKSQENVSEIFNDVDKMFEELNN